MKKAVLFILKTYKKIKLALLKFRGRTPQDISQKRIITGKTWEEFCDTIKLAGASLLFGNSPKDSFNQAEGYRYLARLTRVALENFLEYNDPKAPVLRRMVHETVKMGADNPDNHYLNATISGEYEYRVWGKRGTIHYLSFYTQKGNYTDGSMQPTGFLQASDLKLEQDGSFEIILSTKEHKGNWLQIERETCLLMVRQTLLDRRREEAAKVYIERIGNGNQPESVTPQIIDEGLLSAGKMVLGASLLFAKWANDFQKHKNKLPQFDPEVSNAAGGDKNITYYHSYWEIKEDEALIIEVKPPECDLWNFQLNNYWMESLDYRYYTIHINKHTAEYQDDGSVRIIVAHQDPKLPNWLNTAGHKMGTMCFRWIKANNPVGPKTSVIKFNDLGGLFGQ